MKQERMIIMNQNLEKQLHKLNRWNASNGSFNTRKEYLKVEKKFLEWCSNRHIQSINNIGNKQVRCYIEERLADEIDSRTLKKEMSAIRHFAELAAAMKGEESPITVKNEELGITNEAAKLREGINPDELKAAKGWAETNGTDRAMATAIELGYHFGLRSREIFCLTVADCRAALDSGYIAIINGSKGGRKRGWELSGVQREVIKNALERHSEGLYFTDRLLAPGRNSVKFQLSRWHNFWSRQQDKIAHEGRPEDDRPAAHSLRRQFARNEFQRLIEEEGLAPEKAAGIVSNLLGHGASRKDITHIYLGF